MSNENTLKHGSNHGVTDSFIEPALMDEPEWDLTNSPFFADIDSTIPPNPIGFTIPRPHRPPMDPKYARETIEHLKKLTAQSSA